MADSSAVLATRNFLIKYKDYVSTNALPADTVDYGAAWTGFTDLGLFRRRYCVQRVRHLRRHPGRSGVLLGCQAASVDRPDARAQP